MNKKLFLLLVILQLFLLNGCLTLVPANVDPVAEPGVSSLLLVEASLMENYGMGYRDSSNQNVDEGWYPLVEGPDGSLVAFKYSNRGSKGGPYYYAENVSAGRYTIIGWRYLWMTQTKFLNTPIKDLKFGGPEPRPFQNVDDRMLDTPYSVDVKAGTIATLGTFSIKYAVVSAKDMNADNKREIFQFEWTGHDKAGTNIMSDITSWKDDNWPQWNAYK